MPRRLHIGGKQVKPGWEILNIMPGPHVDHVADANDLSIFEDETFDEIYASHILEHLDHNGEIIETLKEWNRVLKTEGRLYVSVPDFDVLAGMFLDKESYTEEERYKIMRMIFGGHVNEYDYHKIGFDLDIMAGYLTCAGFTKLQRVERFGIFNDASDIRIHDRLISLSVIVFKD